MKIEIISKKDEPLLNRKVVIANVSYDAGTSTRDEIKNNLAAQLGVKSELLSVNKIKTSFRRRDAVVTAHAYENESDLKNVELKKYVRKNDKNYKAEGKGEEKAEAKK